MTETHGMWLSSCHDENMYCSICKYKLKKTQNYENLVLGKVTDYCPNCHSKMDLSNLTITSNNNGGIMKIKIKRINDNAIIPTSGSEYSAGYDLYATPESDTIEIPAGETAKIGTGICTEIPNGYFGAVFARSGIATKRGLRPSNCVGVIDSDYRGEIIVALHNDSKENQTIRTGDRIAQLVVMPYLQVEFEEAENLDETERGKGGFGSTGTN